MTANHVRIAALMTALVIVVATLVMLAFRPEIWSQVLAFTGPTVAACLVLARLEEYHAAVNSRVDALIEVTREKARTEGILEERANPGGKQPRDTSAGPLLPLS